MQTTISCVHNVFEGTMVSDVDREAYLQLALRFERDRENIMWNLLLKHS
jgi:hypothetical protein